MDEKDENNKQEEALEGNDVLSEDVVCNLPCFINSNFPITERQFTAYGFEKEA